MTKEDRYVNVDPNSASTQTHLSILQNVISRMASNSSSCKSWCITLVSAILVIVAGKGEAEYAWIALLPTVLFAAMDAYYLALEKGFRQSYNRFVRSLGEGEVRECDLYFVNPSGSMFRHHVEAVKSFSVWGFYVSLAAMIFFTKSIALG